MRCRGGSAILGGMLREASFRNFKALADVRVRLGEVTCLVGANASGKTSVLEGIECLTRLALRPEVEDEEHLYRRFDGIFGGRYAPDRVRTVGVSDAIILELLSAQSLQVKLTPEAGGSSWLRQAKLTGPGMSVEYREKKPHSHAPFFSALEATGIASALRLRLDPERLREPSFSEDEIPRLDREGAGLASVISFLLSDRSPAVASIEEDLAKIVPGAGRLKARPSQVSRSEREVLRINNEAVTRTLERKVPGHRLELLGRGGEGIPAEHLSEGTLLVIGLLTVLHTNPGLKLLLLDDIDRGLHPRAQRTLVELLLKIRSERPELQIVCTTHSPFVLDLFAPEDVRVMKRDADGLAHCQELTAHPEWSRWKETLKAGEFWSFVGEDWVG